MLAAKDPNRRSYGHSPIRNVPMNTMRFFIRRTTPFAGFQSLWRATGFLVCLLASMLGGPALQAKPLQDLRVLYLGKPDTDRANEFRDFLEPNVRVISVADRDQFKPGDADGFDVVLLDWPQTGVGLDTLQLNPLGKRSQWHKPTVLLGSAGLLTAVSWQVRGGSGCTCLFPFVYGIKNDAIFRGPVPVHMKMWTRPTPGVWAGEIKTNNIEVLPLVDDYTRNWDPGWCSYSGGFGRQPEMEFFCSGINDKTPTAGALWRQGNLFNFGFQQSPAEMNEAGQALLLNVIAYISHFSQDQPIAITPSAFVANNPSSRDQVLSRLKREHGGVADMVTPEVLSEIQNLDLKERLAWWQSSGRFLHPNAAGQLTVDRQLAALGVPFDTPDFFEKAIAGLETGGDNAESDRALLIRYAPEGPAEGSAEAWSRWWSENRPYLFPLEMGRYRWYIDPVARARGIPTSELRGSKRADPNDPL
jgi:hypothetical protein